MILYRIPNRPKSEELKRVYKFAFIPTWVQDELIWLEGYYQNYLFKYDFDYGRNRFVPWGRDFCMRTISV